MQLNDGPHGAWAGACRTSSGIYLVYTAYRPPAPRLAPDLMLGPDRFVAHLGKLTTTVSY